MTQEKIEESIEISFLDSVASKGHKQDFYEAINSRDSTLFRKNCFMDLVNAVSSVIASNDLSDSSMRVEKFMTYLSKYNLFINSQGWAFEEVFENNFAEVIGQVEPKSFYFSQDSNTNFAIDNYYVALTKLGYKPEPLSGINNLRSDCLDR